MRIIHPRSGGIDVHKKQVAACVIWSEANGAEHVEQASFGTYTRELKRLAEWMREREVVDVAMEATGPYWRPVWNVLEAAGLRLTLANPAHIRAIPGHKTDRRDARWIADLHRYGLVPSSFVPSQAQRHLRDLTRMRSKVVQDRSRVVCRLQSVLEDANIKLDSVVSDILGVSSQEMLRGLIGGHRSAGELADLARGSMRRKRKELELALEGEFTEHHAYLVQRLMIQERNLRQQEQALEKQILRYLDPSQLAAMKLWDSIPGVNEKVGAILVAEIGIHAEQFANSAHLASWAGVCPGSHESAGKRKSGKICKGNRWLRTALVEAAWAATRTKGTYLAALYRRLSRKGNKRALLAVAHAILVAAYEMLKTGQPYREPGQDYFDRLRPKQSVKILVQRLNRLGYKVELSLLEGSSATQVTAM